MNGFPTPTQPPTPCWHCTGYDGLTAQGTAALCRRPGCCRVRSQPHLGCDAWAREPGADDTGEPPAGYQAPAG